MEAWGKIWGGAAALAGALGVLGVIVAALVRLHRLANRFETVERTAREHGEKIAAQARCDEGMLETLARLEKGISEMLRSDIYGLCIDAMHKGCCSQDRRKLINDLNAQHRATGGNGDVKDIVKRTFDLPLDGEREGKG